MYHNLQVQITLPTNSTSGFTGGQAGCAPPPLGDGFEGREREGRDEVPAPLRQIPGSTPGHTLLSVDRQLYLRCDVAWSVCANECLTLRRDSSTSGNTSLKIARAGIGMHDSFNVETARGRCGLLPITI